MFSESHCHLESLSSESLEQALKKAEGLGVELILTAGIELPTSELATKIAGKYSVVKACVGIHPWNADLYNDEALHRLRVLAASREVVAISEIGLDYVGRRNRDGKQVCQDAR